MKKVLFTLIALLVLCLAVSVASADFDVPEGSWINYGQIDEVTSIGGHNIVDYDVIIEPTCTEPGMVKYYCDTLHAGDTTSSHVLNLNPNGHDWSSYYSPLFGKVVRGAFCNAPGLAVDYCLDCGLENWENTREILADHVYDEKHYEVVYEPSCTENGWAVHTCIYCGQWNPDDAAEWKYVVETPAYGYLLEGNTNLIKLPMLKHKWTKWTITESSKPCTVYGEAKRACEWCGATQELNEKVAEVVDQGKVIKRDEIIPLYNANWEKEMAFVDGMTFTTENALFGALANLKTVKYDAYEELYYDCYHTIVKYECPCCKGSVHPDVTYYKAYPMVAAHVWEKSKALSYAPTCTEKGKDVYLCIHDYDMAAEYKVEAWHGHPATIEGGFEDPAMLEVEIPALGHDWGEWVTADEYVNDKGETVVRQTRRCTRKGCAESENRVINKGDVKPEGTLNLDETDGKYKYYLNGALDTSKTGFVNFQGGKFWVTKGIVDTSLNGLINCPGDEWLFFSQGQVQKVTQWAEYAGEWFLIKDGALMADANGLYDYNGGTFAIAAGRKLHVNGLWQDPKSGKWVFLADGQLQKVTQQVTYDGATFNVVDGVLAE